MTKTDAFIQAFSASGAMLGVVIDRSETKLNSLLYSASNDVKFNEAMQSFLPLESSSAGGASGKNRIHHGGIVLTSVEQRNESPTFAQLHRIMDAKLSSSCNQPEEQGDLLSESIDNRQGQLSRLDQHAIITPGGKNSSPLSTVDLEEVASSCDPLCCLTGAKEPLVGHNLRNLQNRSLSQSDFDTILGQGKEAGKEVDLQPRAKTPRPNQFASEARNFCATNPEPLTPANEIRSDAFPPVAESSSVEPLAKDSTDLQRSYAIHSLQKPQRPIIEQPAGVEQGSGDVRQGEPVEKTEQVHKATLGLEERNPAFSQKDGADVLAGQGIEEVTGQPQTGTDKGQENDGTVKQAKRSHAIDGVGKERLAEQPSGRYWAAAASVEAMDANTVEKTSSTLPGLQSTVSAGVAEAISPDQRKPGRTLFPHTNQTIHGDDTIIENDPLDKGLAKPDKDSQQAEKVERAFSLKSVAERQFERQNAGHGETKRQPSLKINDNASLRDPPQRIGLSTEPAQIDKGHTSAAAPPEAGDLKMADLKQHISQVSTGVEGANGKDADSNRWSATFQDTERPVPTESSAQSADKSSNGHTMRFARLESALPGGDQHSIMSQIVEKASLRKFRNQSELQVRLKPDFLGKVKMTVSTKNEQVAVRIVTDQTMVKESIGNNLHQLKAELQNQGLNIDKFEVIVNPDSEQQSGREQFSQMFKEPSSPNGKQQPENGNPEGGERQGEKNNPKDQSQGRTSRKRQKRQEGVDQFV